MRLTKFRIFLLVLTLLIFFRGPIFRCLVTYEAVGERTTIAVSHPKLIQRLDVLTEGKDLVLDHLVTIAKEVTTKELSFSTKETSSDPNVLIETHRANCVGYAAMFQSIVSYLINKHGLHNEIYSEHRIGKMKFLGVDLHQFFSSSFFKDHDYNQVVHRNTGQEILIDLSVSDYLWIDRVSGDEN